MKQFFSTTHVLQNVPTALDRVAGLLVGLGILIRIPLILFSSEVWRPEDTASVAHFFLVNGFHILYPQIYWGGNGPGYVEAEFQLYPFLVSILYYILGERMWLGRFVSFLFSAATIIPFYLLAKKLLAPREVLWSLILFSWSLVYIRYGSAFMPEAAMMFFYVGGLFFFVKWLAGRCFRFLLLASLSTSLAILLKPTAIHVGLFFALLAIFQLGVRSTAKDWKIWLAGLVCMIPVVLYYRHAHELYTEYGNTFGVISGGDSKFGNLSYWLSPQFYLGLAQMELHWVFGPAGILAFGIGLVQSIKRHSYFLLFSFITILAYYLITARYSGYSRGTQYHIFMVPYAALGFGIGVEWLSRLRSRHIGTIAVWISIFAVVLWSARFYPRLLRTGARMQFITCARQVQQIVPEDSLMVVSSPYPSVDGQNIPNNYQEPMVFYYSQRRGWSLPTDWMRPEKMEGLRRMGAKYYVILDRDLPLLGMNPGLLDYMEQNLNQVNAGTESSCRIYQFSRAGFSNS